MNLRRIFFTLCALLLASFAMRAQSGGGVEVDYTAPKSYYLGGVKVEGNTYFSEQQILSLTGLRKGKQITIPGEDVTTVVKRLWQQRYFEDVSISADSLSAGRDSVWLKISLLERPRVSKWTFSGIKV